MPSSHGRVVRACAVAALGGLIFGYDTSVVNGAVDAVKQTFAISDLLLGMVVSATLLGAAIGAWFAGRIADRLGRVQIMRIAALAYAVSVLVASVAQTPWWLMGARVVGGIAIGLASVMAPAYIAEIAPPAIRGRLGSLHQLGIVLGIFAGLVVVFALGLLSGGAEQPFPWGGLTWRWMFASAAVPGLVYGLLALRIPLSPRYLVKNGRTEQARQVLLRYTGGDVDEELRQIEKTLAGGAGRVRLADLRGPRLGLQPVVWVGMLLAAFQQLVGINVIFYYSSLLWQAVGFSEETAILTSLFTSVVNICTTFIAIALIDKVGRRPLLLSGAAGMALTLGTLAFCFGTATGEGEELTLGPVAGPVALVAANLFVVAFGASWGPVVWVLLGEVFNNKIRATALAVATATQWLTNWLVSTTFPSLAEISLGIAYGGYAAFALLALIFVHKGVRETKGKALEEM